jgi:hypothetical protein
MANWTTIPRASIGSSVEGWGNGQWGSMAWGGVAGDSWSKLVRPTNIWSKLSKSTDTWTKIAKAV